MARRDNYLACGSKTRKPQCAKSLAPGRRLSGLADGRQSRSAAAKRDRVRREIFDTLPVERIGAATGLMMRWQLTDPPSNVGVARFIASLNLRELQELRRLAQQTRADGALGQLACCPPLCRHAMVALRSPPMT